MIGAPTVYGAATLHVNAATGVDSVTCGPSNDPCLTIGQAIANASAGDSIVVAAGTYSESDGYQEAVTVDKSLTLEGAQAGHAGTATRAQNLGGESVIAGGAVNIAASDVTLNGFAFDYAGTQVCVTCFNGTVGTTSNATIENNVFTDYEPDNYGDWFVTSALGVNSAPGTQITGNYFTSPDHAAVGAIAFFNGGCGSTVIRNNTFDGAANDGLGTIFFYCDDTAGTDITVSGNDDTHVGDTNGESGVVFEEINGDIHLTDNTVTESSTSGSAFYFTLSAQMGTVDITGNSVVGSGSSSITIRPTGGGTGTYTITGNRLSGGKYGLYAYSSSLASGATVTMRANDITGDSQDGVYNDSSSGGHIDAVDNWWGCNAGPGQAGCTVVSGDVAYDPKLVLGVSASPTSVSAGASSTVTADLTRDSSGTDTSGSETVPDGTSVGFSTDHGAVSHASVGTHGGKASVKVSAKDAGTAHVSATVANESVSTAVSFTAAATTSTQTTGTTTGTTAGASALGTPSTSGSVSVVFSRPGAPPPVNVTVDWGPGTFAGPVVVTLTPEPQLVVTSGGFAIGSILVELDVTSHSGAKVTSFDQPLRIHISAAGAGDLPAYSSDGIAWTIIPLLKSLPLPAGQPDGYVVNADGSVDIYTRHATLFGYVKDVQAPSAATLRVRVTRTQLRFAIVGAHDNVAVSGYVVSRNGRGYRAVKTSYFPLPLRAGSYFVVVRDSAHNVSAKSNTITVVRTRNKRHPFAIRS